MTLVVMPQLGMSMERGTVTGWPRAVGERVDKGDVVVIIETEKAEAEVEATGSGTLRHLYVDVGETVPCGTLLAALTERPDEPFDPAAVLAAHRASAPAAPRASAGSAGGAADGAGAAPSPTAGARSVVATPRARRLARELGVDLAQVRGSGPRGRVTEEDVRSAGRGPRIEVEAGVELEVLEAGQGETVLLLPGFGADASLYSLLTPILLEDHRLLAVHPRGVGRSSDPEAEVYTVARGAADAAAVAAATQDGPVHVVGTSLGAATALELALDHPERVRSLVLLAPFVTARARLLAVLDSWRLLVRDCAPATVAKALVPWLFAEATLADDAGRGRLERGLAEMVTKTGAASLDRWARGIRQWSGTRRAALAEVEVPTLVLLGAEDLLTPPEPDLWRSIVGVEVQVVPQAGHGLVLEAPTRVGAEVAAHVARVDERES